MIVLIPMAGAGSRFVNAGYKLSKPLIPVTSHKTGEKIPMIIAALQDLPDPHNKVILIDRDFHKEHGVEEEIKKYVPNAEFITIDYLTGGQASTCLLAQDKIDNDEELIIGACDNGIVYNEEAFNQAKGKCDVIIFSFRNNESVAEKPQAYGWIKTNHEDVIAMSIKVPISATPKDDHAVVGTFWFKRGHDFVRATQKMIEENDRINDEFYVDQTIQHAVNFGLKVKVFEVERYICWGTPIDYENYENSIQYWEEFRKNEDQKS